MYLLAEGLPTIIPPWWFLQVSFPPAVVMAETHPDGPGRQYYTYTGHFLALLAIYQRFKQNTKELMITWILWVYDREAQHCP